MWFSRAIIFRQTDPYEGAPTQFDRQKRDRVLSAKTKDELQEAWPEISSLMSQVPKSLSFFQALFLSKVQFLDINLYGHSISCWHENPSESDAMWALYAQRDAGIAIMSTVSRALNAFASSKRNIVVAKVNYDSTGGLSALTSGNYDSLLIKRHAFHHENEIRMIASSFDGYEAPEWSEDNQRYNLDFRKSVPSGVYVECDIQLLIEKIVLSPSMPSYCSDALETISKRLIPDIPIRKSTLLTRDEDIPRKHFSQELMKIWDHHCRTNLLLDFNEIPSPPPTTSPRV